MTKGALFLTILCGLLGEPPVSNHAPPQPHRFLATGQQGMVVGLTGRRSVHAGLEILKQGGSAADAAMTTSMTQIVEVAGSYISFAGIMSMTYYDAASHKFHYLNACFNTPLDEKDPLSIPRLDPFAGGAKPHGRTVLVPGFMAGVQASHARFGKLPFARLFEPAIRLADEGFEVDSVLSNFIQFRKDVLSRLPDTRRVFTKEAGKLYQRGDLFRQPELAKTLRDVAANGVSYLYSGDWARRFVTAVRNDGGVLTLRDLELYHVLWEDPLETTYGDVRIHAPGPSSRGGVATLEALNLLELARLKPRGLPTESAETLFWLMQICNNQEFSFSRDRVAKQHPGQDLSVGARTTKQNARWIWDRMQAGEWPLSIKPESSSKSRGTHSSGVVVVDRWGNVAAVTHSINTALWGKTGIFVGGISIPDSAAFQQEAIKEAGPGNRLPDPMSPLIITRAGSPVLASTAIGGGLHQRNIQVLSNILEFGMNAQAAALAPAFLLPEGTGRGSRERVTEGAFDKKVIDGVRALGQEVKEVSPQERAAYIGYWAGIQLDPKTGLLQGAGTAELPSFAEGY